MTLKFIDFFAGVGGFRKGLEMAGHKCVGFVEWDKFARQSYQAIFETEGEYTEHDIRAVRANELPRANIWCFGFPCQDISIAGKQEGFDGERSSLFYGVTKLIRELKKEDKPELLFIENVKNLLSVNDGFDFLRLQVELDEIGYNLEWDVLNSKYFRVPQNRERAFIIGHLRGKHTRKVFPFRGESETITENNIKPINDSKKTRDLMKYDSINRFYDIDGISPTLDTMQGGNREPKIGINYNGVMVVGKIEVGGFDNNGNIHDDNGVSPTITTRNGGEQGIKIIQKGRGFNKGGEHDITPTLTSNSYHENNMLRTDDFQIRKLTPLECWRLQGWEDEMFYRAKFGSKEIARRIIAEGIDHYNCEFEQTMSDSQLYKQAGNGVTVTVIYEIAKRLKIEVE
ncbi:DNA cytosine methyltransferase [Carnobacterium maltaromaticum]|uniref:DNA cytosine methyltransferase n=1 Tax=Carnobacterium maltaromaticum TaxID=2751 RepID=UPI00165C7A97|nr:DNA cytosine methyltransferase [Carnobacterium maltaromaticum]MBC9787202.1 DNA (cytosine-5-)-methyltransferase [Carnobacterium maltaromaticum]